MRVSPLRTLPFALAAALLLTASPAAAESPWPDKSIDELYDRIAADLLAGRPLVVTVHVALCDNDFQGIVPTRNRSICQGDEPEKNLYWASGGGLKGRLTRLRWKRVLYERHDDGPVAITAVWQRMLRAGGALRARGVRGSVPVTIVGLAYRGRNIQEAMVDYLHAVGRDDERRIELPDGTVLAAGGASHVVGYVGHDHFMDAADSEALEREGRGPGRLHKGVFGLACVSDDLFRPAIQRRTNHVLALNPFLTFPSAYTVVGLVTAVAAGKDHRGIHAEAARRFAEGQGRPVGSMRKTLTYGDR